MAVNKKNIMTRYFFVILLMALIGVAIVVKAGITMFAERQYWQDVADRFVKENVTVKPNRGNIISSDGVSIRPALSGWCRKQVRYHFSLLWLCLHTHLPVYGQPVNRTVSYADCKLVP